MKNQVRFFIGLILMLFICLPCVESSAQSIGDILVQVLNSSDDESQYQQKRQKYDGNGFDDLTAFVCCSLVHEQDSFLCSDAGCGVGDPRPIRRSWLCYPLMPPA